MTKLIIDPEPKIIGLYGLPGSGKSTLLGQLKEDPTFSNYLFFEGTRMISSLVEGGIGAFKKLDEHLKEKLRCEAIEKIRDKCLESGMHGVVAGHFSFWSRKKGGVSEVWTSSDAEVFTHIVYLRVNGASLQQHVRNDRTRLDRVDHDPDLLDTWQNNEMGSLEEICKSSQKDIKFVEIDGGTTETLEKARQALKATDDHDHKYNRDLVKVALEACFSQVSSGLDAVMLIDGDRTLAPEDTGKLPVKQTGMSLPTPPNLDKIFREYSYTFEAFRTAASRYAMAFNDDQEYEAWCDMTATQVSIHPQFEDLLQRLSRQESAKALVVTCGQKRVWEKVLQSAGLSHVSVIGAGRANDYVVTPNIKAAIAKILQKNGYYVWAFGDSTIDLAMLKQADQAIVVVGEQESRSKSMEERLRDIIEKKGLEARQILFPGNVPPRLDRAKLPIASLGNLDIVTAFTDNFEHLEATDKPAAKLLMTPTRDPAFQGPSLREAHRNVGRYLATEYLSELLGVQQYQMDHVQSAKKADGYRLFHEKKTLIIPLMRGGEPLAFGVNDVFPLAAFLHAKKPEEIHKKHLRGMTTVILVDAVVNTGASLVEVVKRVRELRPTVRIVGVSGVTQDGALEELPRMLGGCGGFTLVSLRASKNKFTGKGGTDTGARLFNTTEMEME